MVNVIRMNTEVSLLVLPSWAHCTGFSDEANTLHNSLKGSKDRCPQLCKMLRLGLN